MSMVKIKLNNIEIEAEEGLTILDVAKKAGFNISTLCHNEGLPHYSSCMVCMVKDKFKNNFIPSCSALIQDGMDIDISGEEVISLRRKAIEMLLSEHRAECEAPCKVVCPAGYNIPVINRFLSANDFEGATSLLSATLGSSGIMCTTCPGYCENACRRKKVDTPVSIRNLLLHISLRANQDKPSNEIDDRHTGNEIDIHKDSISGKLPKRFSSHIGRLEISELQEWLKESTANARRSMEITSPDLAALEAGSCMHCDCRAAEYCKLREIAEEYSVKDPRGKLVNSPIVKKINHNTGLIFENAKCIKCGLCVRLCEDSKEEPALCFIHRGFVSIISEPLTEEFDNILKSNSKDVIDICPTGALSQMK